GAELTAVAAAAVARAVEVDAATRKCVADPETLPALGLDRHQQRGCDPGCEPVGQVAGPSRLVREAPAALLRPQLRHGVGEQVIEGLDRLGLGIGLEHAPHTAAQGAHALEITLAGDPRLTLETVLVEELAQVADPAQELG